MEINLFYVKLNKTKQHSDDICQKYHYNRLRNFCAICEVQKTDNATTFKLRSDDKVR